jgi:hypothetical protein
MDHDQADGLTPATPGVARVSPFGDDTDGPLIFGNERRWCGAPDGPMPTRVLITGQSVPDLRLIDPSLWEEVLLPIPTPLRFKAIRHHGLGCWSQRAFEVADSLPPTASETVRAAVTAGPTIPYPVATRQWPGRQVNLRVREEEYEELQTAARLLGAKPAQLVRMLVLNGARRVIAEHDAALAQPGTTRKSAVSPGA